MPTYKTVESFQTVETTSETITEIIRYNQVDGYAYCGDCSTTDGQYCFICLVFKRDDDFEQYSEMNNLTERLVVA